MEPITSREFIKEKVGEPDFISLQNGELQQWLDEYNARQLRKYDKTSLLETIFLRILGFPIMTVILLIGSIWLFIRHIKNYILFGSETIIYTQNSTRRQIIDIYDQLNKIRLNQIVRDKINEEDIYTKESTDE